MQRENACPIPRKKQYTRNAKRKCVPGETGRTRERIDAETLKYPD
jgi:hypothetical protein